MFSKILAMSEVWRRLKTSPDPISSPSVLMFISSFCKTQEKLEMCLPAHHSTTTLQRLEFKLFAMRHSDIQTISDTNQDRGQRETLRDS